MIAVIVDVGGKQQRVATAHYALLAQVGSAPVDFQPQLVGLHDLWRLRKSFSKLREESDVAVRLRLVIDQTGVGQLARSALGGVLDECPRARIVPRLLCARRRRDKDGGEREMNGAGPHGGKLVAG